MILLRSDAVNASVKSGPLEVDLTPPVSVYGNADVWAGCSEMALGVNVEARTVSLNDSDKIPAFMSSENCCNVGWFVSPVNFRALIAETALFWLLFVSLKPVGATVM